MSQGPARQPGAPRRRSSYLLVTHGAHGAHRADLYGIPSVGVHNFAAASGPRTRTRRCSGGNGSSGTNTRRRGSSRPGAAPPAGRSTQRSAQLGRQEVGRADMVSRRCNLDRYRTTVCPSRPGAGLSNELHPGKSLSPSKPSMAAQVETFKRTRAHRFPAIVGESCAFADDWDVHDEAIQQRQARRPFLPACSHHRFHARPHAATCSSVNSGRDQPPVRPALTGCFHPSRFQSSSTIVAQATARFFVVHGLHQLRQTPRFLVDDVRRAVILPCS